MFPTEAGGALVFYLEPISSSFSLFDFLQQLPLARKVPKSRAAARPFIIALKAGIVMEEVGEKKKRRHYY